MCHVTEEPKVIPIGLSRRSDDDLPKDASVFPLLGNTTLKVTGEEMATYRPGHKSISISAPNNHSAPPSRVRCRAARAKAPNVARPHQPPIARCLQDSRTRTSHTRHRRNEISAAAYA